jgi:hypothetical protein
MRSLPASVLGLALLAGASCGKSDGLLPPPDSDAATDSTGAGLPPAALCTGAPVSTTEKASINSLGENVDLTCASVVGILNWRMGATGSSCTSPLDCTPVCCPCPNGTHHSLTAWCDHGLCAAPEAVACALLGTPVGSYCDN